VDTTGTSQNAVHSKPSRHTNAPSAPALNHAAPNAPHLMLGHLAKFQIPSRVEKVVVS